MTHNKRKKNSRQRGSWTHGWGAKKKHRGAGHRGGRGRAGSGKKGDVKKPSYWKTEKFGKVGFTSLRKKVKAINLSQLQLLIGKETSFDLTKKGYDKLLGAGSILGRVELVVNSASAKAIQKVEKVGGKVILPKKEEAPKVQEQPKGE